MGSPLYTSALSRRVRGFDGHDGVLYADRVVPGAIVGIEFNRKGDTLAHINAFLRSVKVLFGGVG